MPSVSLLSLPAELLHLVAELAALPSHHNSQHVLAHGPAHQDRTRTLLSLFLVHSRLLHPAQRPLLSSVRLCDADHVERFIARFEGDERNRNEARAVRTLVILGDRGGGKRLSAAIVERCLASCGRATELEVHRAEEVKLSSVVKLSTFLTPGAYFVGSTDEGDDYPLSIADVLSLLPPELLPKVRLGSNHDIRRMMCFFRRLGDSMLPQIACDVRGGPGSLDYARVPWPISLYGTSAPCRIEANRFNPYDADPANQTVLRITDSKGEVAFSTAKHHDTTCESEQDKQKKACRTVNIILGCVFGPFFLFGVIACCFAPPPPTEGPQPEQDVEVALVVEDANTSSCIFPPPAEFDHEEAKTTMPPNEVAKPPALADDSASTEPSPAYSPYSPFLVARD
ncbi:hypothetical protein JCM8547_005195 [Rhodosporidiobolus lusitaniae]